MPYKLIGRTTDFKGKSLWEIVGNLKNFGAGRLINRNSWRRYQEPSYTKILKVEPLPDIGPSFDKKRKVIALVERTFRGIKYEKPVQLESATYKSDYYLIHKNDEIKYSETIDHVVQTCRPEKMEFPPLIKEVILRQMEKKNIPIKEEPLMTVVYNKSKKYVRTNTVTNSTQQKLPIGLGTPISPKLYQNIKN